MKQAEADRRLRSVDCEIRCDPLTRQLYATDASIYQIEPAAVAFPKDAEQTAAVMRAASDAGIPITPRGAGTGLAGGAVGSGLIIDLARYTRWISDLDLDRMTVRVGPGVVLDQLNEFLRPHGLCYGPDVATSSRATLGGMISNNSSGARAPIYGTTIDHVKSVDVVLPDGTFATVGPQSAMLPAIKNELNAIIAANAELIRERFPDVLVKRWPAYALDDCLNYPGDLSKIVAGSEGTLAAVVAAELKLVRAPRQKGLGVIFFETVEEAMQATVALLPLKPAAIEHVDKVLFDQTCGQLEFRGTRDLLGLDDHPCGAFLIVEFYEDVEARLADLHGLRLGLRTISVTEPGEMLRVWGLRKRGLSLLSGCKGPAKPIAGVEDVAVRPERLPEYVAAVKESAGKIGLKMSFYGHAASGLLHIRPVIDLHRGDSIAKYRQLALEISRITKSFHGSLTGEHGVGIARAEFMEEHLGAETLEVMRRIKALFDPKGLMNPGKVFPGGGHRIDTHLRFGDGHEIKLPFEPVLAFAHKDGSFVRNLEQCNGCGDCRKDPPVMCPTFTATGEEVMSTRGRANTIRAALEGRLDYRGDALLEAIGNCLSCKACKKECPSNVDMALLKAELLHARQRERGTGLLERFVSRFDLLGRVGTMAPRLMNTLLNARPARVMMEKVLGLAADRPLPAYARERFEDWFGRRGKKGKSTRGTVYLWNDCTTRFFEPEIGRAAVHVLEAAGYEVLLANTGACCGRPAFSVGRLDVARRFGETNVRYFVARQDNAPIIFLEPSCYSMYAGDYEELRIADARNVAARCILFEQFVHELLKKEPDALKFAPRPGSRVAIHAHCHAKALTDTNVVAATVRRVPNVEASMLDTGCCGMAGSFGALRDKYALSVAVAQPLVDCVNKLPAGTALISSGTSCRQQISHLTNAKPVHFAQWLESVVGNP
jgi:FAD/FMN-containing dehydrogenase/Fe-S oxidoreductase